MSRYNEVGAVILGMEKLKIGLMVGAMMFIVAIALQNTIAVIGSVLFTCGVALAIWGFEVGE